MQEAAELASFKPKFMHKTSRGFPEGKGPRSLYEPRNYNQRLRTFVEDAIDESEDRPERFPYMVETFFQENLLKRYNLIRYLKAEIRQEKAKNAMKRKVLGEQKARTEQRNLSKTLVNNFKECIDQVVREKEVRVNENNKGKYIRVSRSDLKNIEKRKILENFVENDEALGQLLDFISSHYI